uniref:Uncharacterized protein n=1 Tax=Chromera velia CCMP2878 TaxID=1169474 RepID=A0A0G4FJ58_9ALVE|eukprot:Cvel_17316.t1-p1 / transcript=Cvel_17316.t1 / gene=Cvel_17316 / organism=Chromera_velia_CCMP2878 / gene_product=hypothetical protein / transcript_product=hypothetical protein / location=Cvel_scaffold1375:18499-18750(-) / protein_length=84 / sequence_SO=supercontig / SO=protein_coding / is_pseudo=false
MQALRTMTPPKRIDLALRNSSLVEYARVARLGSTLSPRNAVSRETHVAFQTKVVASRAITPTSKPVLTTAEMMVARQLAKAQRV